MMENKRIALALVFLGAAAAPVAAADQLFQTPVLTNETLSGLQAIHSATTNSLFAQTAVSVGSTAIATVLPSSGPGVGQATDGRRLAFDAFGNPLYLVAGANVREQCLSNCLQGTYQDEFGHIVPADFRYSTDDVVPSGGATSLAGVESLTNLSASALNTVTVSGPSSTSFDLQYNSFGTIEGLDQSIPGFATQLAIADDTSSTANLNIPNVTAGMTTMSNTALGAVNTISVNIVNVPTVN